MNLALLESAVRAFQKQLFTAIRTATYGGKVHENGHVAKTAAIRSQSLIFNLHESVKKSLAVELSKRTHEKWECFPPLGQSSPELKTYGLLKGKKQDVVFLREKRVSEDIREGANAGEIDLVGVVAMKSCIVIGVRSQLSSIEKNRDTLMERAFAETLNLRLRAPEITMGEVYMIPLNELDDLEMKKNKTKLKTKVVNVAKFIRTFTAVSGRSDLSLNELYRYDATALVLVDLSTEPATIIRNSAQLATHGFSKEVCQAFEHVQPEGFDERIVAAYARNQKLSKMLAASNNAPKTN